VIPKSLALSTTHCYVQTVTEGAIDLSRSPFASSVANALSASKDKHDAYLSATSFASMGWLLPVSNLILLDAMAVAWLLAA